MRRELVRVEDLTVRFEARERVVHAVNGVDLALAEGETLGLLGESGSGKSVTLRSLMRLLPPRRARIGGRILFAGEDVLAMDARRLEDHRGRSVAMVFQEPMLAFDPVFTIGEQIAETVRRHEGVDRAAARRRALEMLERVRIPGAARRLDAYPHEMSGGMRQRAMIALALSCRPRLLLADEPTTALDVTIQAQILDLLRQLQEEMNMAVIVITHNMGVVAEFADRVIVMYAGRIAEHAGVDDVFYRPGHPYTEGLLRSIPDLEVETRRLRAIPGVMPSPFALPAGCRFQPRCPEAKPACAERQPALVDLGEHRHAACIRHTGFRHDGAAT